MSSFVLTPARLAQRRKNAATMSGMRRAKMLCKRGHVLAGSNIYVRPDGRRMCRRCHNDRRWYAERGIEMVRDARSGDTDAYQALLRAVLDRNLSLDEARDVLEEMETR